MAPIRLIFCEDSCENTHAVRADSEPATHETETLKAPCTESVEQSLGFGNDLRDDKRKLDSEIIIQGRGAFSPMQSTAFLSCEILLSSLKSVERDHPDALNLKIELLFRWAICWLLLFD